MKTTRSSAWSSISRRLPEWMLARPYTVVPCLRWLNAFRRYRWLLPSCLAASVILMWAVTRARFGSALEIAASHPQVVAIVACAWSYIATVRRKARMQTEDASSWLSPLPVPRSRVLRMALAPVLQLFALALVLAIAVLAGPRFAVAARLFVLVAGGFTVGLLFGWVIRQGSSGAVPDSHRARPRRPRQRWADAPTLTPLSYWSAGQVGVLLQPKVAARAALLVLLSLPLGISGNQALAIAAAAMIVLSLAAHTVAAVRVALAAGAWLVTTPVEGTRFAVAVGSRTVLTQLALSAAALFLAGAISSGAAIRRLFAMEGIFVLASAAAIALTAHVALRPAVASRVRALTWLK